MPARLLCPGTVGIFFPCQPPRIRTAELRSVWAPGTTQVWGLEEEAGLKSGRRNQDLSPPGTVPGRHAEDHGPVPLTVCSGRLLGASMPRFPPQPLEWPPGTLREPHTTASAINQMVFWKLGLFCGMLLRFSLDY